MVLAAEEKTESESGPVEAVALGGTQPAGHLWGNPSMERQAPCPELPVQPQPALCLGLLPAAGLGRAS